MLQLDLQIACDPTGLPAKSDFILWANAALEVAEESRRQLTLRLVESEEVQELNRVYRSKDKPTNVLSFPFEPIPEIDEDTLGDIMICKDMVEIEAKEQNKALTAHWAHLVIHGILHLCGHDHISDEEANQMESLEITILSGLGYPHPYNNE